MYIFWDPSTVWLIWDISTASEFTVKSEFCQNPQVTLTFNSKCHTLKKIHKAVSGNSKY